MKDIQELIFFRKNKSIAFCVSVSRNLSARLMLLQKKS